jgi:hypothetical protein
MKHPAILLLLVLTSGCAVNTTPQMWSIFEDMCSANGGIKFAFVALSRRELVCNNGALSVEKESVKNSLAGVSTGELGRQTLDRPLSTSVPN